MRVQKSSRGADASVEGEGTGELLVTIEDFSAGVGETFGVGEAFGEGVSAGVGVAFVIELVDEFVLSAFDLALVLFDDVLPGELSRAGAFLFPVVDGVPRLFAFALRAESTLLGRVKSRGRFEAMLGLPPGTATTTSSLFPRCSTWAVAPGCRRKESTVLSPVRCDFTSENPRPRSASARGTSAAGIFT